MFLQVCVNGSKTMYLGPFSYLGFYISLHPYPIQPSIGLCFGNQEVYRSILAANEIGPSYGQAPPNLENFAIFQGKNGSKMDFFTGSLQGKGPFVNYCY